MTISLSEIDKHIEHRYSEVQLVGKDRRISVKLPGKMLDSGGMLRIGLK